MALVTLKWHKQLLIPVCKRMMLEHAVFAFKFHAAYIANKSSDVTVCAMNMLHKMRLLVSFITTLVTLKNLDNLLVQAMS